MFKLSVVCFNEIDDVACADPELCKEICDNPVGCSDTAYARLVMELLPTGETAFLPTPPILSLTRFKL